MVGQDELVDGVLVALLAGGHVLIEGAPGLGKTLVARALAVVAAATFKRIQFTPDLMPSDVTGSSVFDRQTSAFTFIAGPVFAQLLLADEINRAPAKTQSRSSRRCRTTRSPSTARRARCPSPFIVIATQNPVESQGTYPLPEAQLDRFLFKLLVKRPAARDGAADRPEPRRRLRPDAPRGARARRDARRRSLAMQRTRRRVRVDDAVVAYIVDLVRQTRDDRAIELGASPRASIALLKAAQVIAASEGRTFVTPDDVKPMAAPCCAIASCSTPTRSSRGSRADERIADIVTPRPGPAPGRVDAGRRRHDPDEAPRHARPRRRCSRRVVARSSEALDACALARDAALVVLVARRRARSSRGADRGRAQRGRHLLRRARERRRPARPQHERRAASRDGRRRSGRGRDARRATRPRSSSRPGRPCASATSVTPYAPRPARLRQRRRCATRRSLGPRRAAGAQSLQLAGTSTCTPTSTRRASLELLRRQGRQDARLGSLRVRGGDTEFERLRPYQRGDEIRHIDWRAIARRDDLTVRQYQAESDQNVVFALDVGRAMRGDSGGLTQRRPRAQRGAARGRRRAPRRRQGGAHGVRRRAAHFVHADGGRAGGRKLTRAVYALEAGLAATDYRAGDGVPPRRRCARARSSSSSRTSSSRARPRSSRRRSGALAAAPPALRPHARHGRRGAGHRRARRPPSDLYVRAAAAETLAWRDTLIRVAAQRRRARPRREARQTSRRSS